MEARLREWGLVARRFEGAVGAAVGVDVAARRWHTGLNAQFDARCKAPYAMLCCAMTCCAMRCDAMLC